MAGIKALRMIQLGAESTAGDAVAATARWRGMGTIEDGREVVFPEEDIGLVGGADRSYIPRLAAAISFEDIEATFEQLPYILEAGVQTVSPTTDSGSGYIYSYAFPTTGVNSIQTYTIEGGDNQQAEEMEYAFVEAFTLSGAAGEALKMSADWVGRQVTNTTFTASLSVPSVEEILFSKASLYIDDSTGTVGTTLISNTLLAMNLEVDTGWQVVETATGELYFSFAKSTMPEITLDITFEHDANAVAEKTAWRNQTPRQLRLEFPGSALSTTGTYDTKLLRVDLAGKWESFEPLGEEDGNDTVEATFRMRYNSTAALFGEIVVVNELSALP